ncbi:quinon protein alcohol dehydrogenase-like superfamily [Lipomyces orientalis]|uniref:Quinon protein alcohol dehydrogenase-like superfamily n=1 Tax=Lipomyces orientalis TaxID=1233043 RepID=A0ACC3TZ42_9ASCO
MSATVKHTAIGANRMPDAAATSPDGCGLVAFAADRYIALWRPEDEAHGVRRLLKGHAEPVSAVLFVAPGLIASGSTDGVVKIWSNKSAGDQFDYICTATLQYHSRTVNTLACTPDSRYLIVGGGDAVVSIWSLAGMPNVGAQLQQEIQLDPGHFPLCLAVDSINPTHGSSAVILAIGSTSTRIQVYVSQENEPPNFTKAVILKGHEDWVHGLAFKHFRESDGSDVLYLASGSQDRYIRIWKILPMDRYREAQESHSFIISDPLLSNTIYQFFLTPRPETQTDISSDSYTSSPLSRTPSKNSKNANCADDNPEYAIVFDALLMGHDDWIFSLAWHPYPSDKRLLSSSADSTLMIWIPDETSGIWTSHARLGDLSIKGASSATGSSGGFWVALWDQKPVPRWIATIGKSGGWRVWTAESEIERWTPKVAITGHAREATGLAWAPGGEYLLTTSLDQTTRLLAEWKPSGSEESKGWHEFARPQIHGYDMIAITSLSSTEFVSAGDEKVLRVFEMPRSVAQVLNSLCGFNPSRSKEIDDDKLLPDAASVPSLGLSNKSVAVSSASGNQEDDEEQDDTLVDSSSYSSLRTLTTPPLESQLQRHTLFPEIDKLYGHGYEISSVAVSHSGNLLATTCRANSTTHAVIRLFDTTTWHEIKPPLAEAHALTVTALMFSHDDRYLLSVGRDRLFVVWEHNDDSAREVTGYYQTQYKALRGHTRIIWDGAWAPPGLADGALEYVFATASRDKTVKIWTSDGPSSWAPRLVQRFEDAVTAVDFWPTLVSGETRALLAVGLDNGSIFVYTLSARPERLLKLEQLIALDQKLTPSLSISQISWRPRLTGAEESVYDMAVASDDSSIRIYSISM